MLKADQFEISSIQCSIFTPNIVFRNASILGFLLQQWGDKFDGKPTTMPLPVNAPPEIPSILLVSEDNSLRMEVSQARTNMYWNKTSREIKVDMNTTVAEFTEILQKFLDHLGTLPGRLALVIYRFLPIEETGEVLANHFCREEWLETALKRPKSFQLHSRKKYMLTGKFNINSWMRIKTGRVVADNSSAVLVEQDINTLAEEVNSNQFAPEYVKMFFDESINECNQILSLYFP